MKSISHVVSILRKNIIYQRRFYVTQNNFATHGTRKRIADLFLKTEVQNILKKITGVDYEKIFAARKVERTPHKYEFATEKYLKKLQEEAAAKAVEKLQMPPVMDVREPINEILSQDPELQGYLRIPLVFIDTSSTISSRDRVITVRELDGTLRKATWEERDRMNTIFFPIPGRHLEIPELFNSPNLERLLNEGSYIFVLDSACLQFEPDHPDYHRVTNRTYEHIKQMNKFDVLRSTRHFGPMAFYFVYNKNIDRLLMDMIEKQLMSDASDTIKLLYIMHPELKTSIKIGETSEVAIIQDYIENHSIEKADLEIRLQTFLEQQQSHLQQEEASA